MLEIENKRDRPVGIPGKKINFNKNSIPFFPLKFTGTEPEWIIRSPVNEREWEVNQSAYLALKFCDGYRTLKEISQELAGLYGCDRKEILELIMPLLSELTEEGLVWWRKSRIKYEPTPPPIAVLWDLTSRCNLRCKHCVVDAGVSCEKLDFAECCRLIDELADFGVRQLILSGGEPMLRADFFDIAGYASEKGLYIQVATNGTLIDRTAAERLAEMGAGAQVSLDASTAGVHDDFRQSPGSWEKTLRGMEFLLDAGVTVTLATVVTKNNIEDIPALYELASELGVQTFRILPFVPFGRGKEIRDLEVPPMMMRRLTEQLLKKREKLKLSIAPMEFECTLKPPLQKEVEPDTRIGCDGGIAYCTVTPKGEVLPCNFFAGVETDNVKEKSFEWIWNNSRILNYFRSLVVFDLHGHCRECSWLSSCRGSCVAANFAHGDIFQSNCHCWEVSIH